MPILKELQRRNVFRVALGYIVSSWLIAQVADLVLENIGAPGWVMQTILLLLALGFPVAVFFSWAYEVTPEGIKRESEIDRSQSITHITGRKLDRAIVAALAIALAYFAYDKFVLGPERVAELVEGMQQAGTEPAKSEPAATAEGDNSIAVLPFVNMSDDQTNEFFSEGISEELLNLLASMPELRVIARTSSFSFKGKDVKIADIARELNVAYVLEGSVRKFGNNVRITSQLIRSDDSSHVWSATYDRTLENIFAIQDEIAKAVVSELRVTLLGESVPQSKATDPEAYALFLQGRHLNDLLTQEAANEAEKLLKVATSIDPEFAPAWRELGIAYLSREGPDLATSESRKLAKDAFERALAIDPEYAPVYASLSLLARINFDYSAADEYLEKALQLEDSSGFPYAAAASLSRTFGRFEKSVELAKKSISYNPVHSNSYANLGYSCYYANRLDDAAAAFTRAISLNPENFRSYVYLGRVLLAQGAAKEALGVIQETSWKPYRLTGLAMAYHMLGDTEASNQALSELTNSWGDSMAFQIAEVYAFQGDGNAAFEWLNRALETRDPGLNVLLGDPVFEGLTSDARYHSLVEKLGLFQYFQAMK